MLREKNIICISSIDWDFIWQSHQEIMDTFVRHGNKVLYIENTGVRVPSIADLPRIRKRLINWLRSFRGIRKEKENLFIYSPVILPFPYSRIAALINRYIMLSILRRWMKATGFANPIIWTFLPTRTALGLIRNIDNRLSIYRCAADFIELVRNKRKIQRSEREILKTVDLVFAQGKVLKDRCLKYNKNVYIFPGGVRGDLFDRLNGSKLQKACPDDIKNIKGVKIGYIGGLHKHIDYQLLEDLARREPEWSIILIGPDQISYSLKEKPKNIKMLGMKKYEELPDYVNSMDVCIIPYKINEYTKTVYPSKLNEYLLMGKPVVSTDLPEIEEFNRLHGNVVYIAESKEEFMMRTESALSDANPQVISKRREAAMANTWEKRIEKMSEVIEKTIVEKETFAERGWKENLITVYRKAKKRVIETAAVLGILYLMVFHSPLVWFLAEPLKISHMPQRADAIVVFGGGVGETGSPGKSTIERARFSADLYKKGFSKTIIYSSGYTYKYNDAENMRLIALSMGIPEKNIILEQKAGSTYENVKYTSRILEENAFNKILLVSSPYNMRRASLVFKHIAKDIKVIYVPIPEPQFYYRKEGVKLGQIRAIMHEYIGILYYVFKGYIW